MLLKKASEEVKKEADERASEKSTFISKNVADLDMASLDQEALIELCEDLHDQLVCAEADKFDMEVVVRRQDMEVSRMKGRMLALSMVDGWSKGGDMV